MTHNIGWRVLKSLEQLQHDAHRNGFKLSGPRHGGYRDADVFALSPRDDELPIYSRDTELFIGDLDDCIAWLRGFSFAKEYMGMVRACDRRRLDRYEQNYRNTKLVNILKQKEGNNEVV
jgi:hypothetical protein